MKRLQTTLKLVPLILTLESTAKTCLLSVKITPMSPEAVSLRNSWTELILCSLNGLKKPTNEKMVQEAKFIVVNTADFLFDIGPILL